MSIILTGAIIWIVAHLAQKRPDNSHYACRMCPDQRVRWTGEEFVHSGGRKYAPTPGLIDTPHPALPPRE